MFKQEMETHQQNVQLLRFIFHGIVICRHFKQTFAFQYIRIDLAVCHSNTASLIASHRLIINFLQNTVN